jgi:hypothetical protein
VRWLQARPDATHAPRRQTFSSVQAQSRMIRCILFAVRFKRLKAENPHLFDATLALDAIARAIRDA